MNAMFLGPYLVLCATLMRALYVAAKGEPKVCARCARPRERRELGEQLCGCGH